MERLVNHVNNWKIFLTDKPKLLLWIFLILFFPAYFTMLWWSDTFSIFFSFAWQIADIFVRHYIEDFFIPTIIISIFYLYLYRIIVNLIFKLVNSFTSKKIIIWVISIFCCFGIFFIALNFKIYDSGSSNLIEYVNRLLDLLII